MNISIELIKKIREESGAGMSDVKEALDKAQGDEQKALEILRKNGQKIAAKKSDRDAKEGVISITSEGNKVAVVGLNCETDFVARNENFLSAVQEFSKKLMEVGEADFKAWAEDEIKNNLVVKIGENLQLAHAKIIEASPTGEGDVIGSYLHSNKKVASVVVLNGGTEELAKEVAMQVTAMNPQYNSPEDVPVEVIEKEKEIYKEQLKKEGKPEKMLEKILEGKINKYYSDVCLVKQTYVKDDKMTIEKLLDGATVAHFSKFSL